MGVHVIPPAGAFFEARYPFVRETYVEYDADGPSERETWRPGIRPEPISLEDSAMVADATGTIILTVIATFKPGKFPTRVFFTRRWRDPDGREFGKGALRIATVSKFYELTCSYRHEYEMATPSQGVAVMNWNDHAKRCLKAELARRNVSYKQLSRLLEKIGHC